MKNTRKKMLLSSVAMLLVALVALGSATFAWYYTNATVTASTSRFSASTSDGLVIRHTKEEEWKTTVTDLNSASNLTPASIDYAGYSIVIGGTGTGTSYENGELNEKGLTKLDHDTVVKASGTSNDNPYFLVDDFYVATPSASSKSATFKAIGNTVPGTYMNLAIYVDGTLQKVLTSDPEASETTKKVKTESGNTVTTDTETQSIEKMSSEGVTVSSDVTVNSNTNGADGTHIQIIGFADGYNPKCTSKTANVTEVTCTYEFTLNAD